MERHPQEGRMIKDSHRKCQGCNGKGKCVGTKHATKAYSVRSYRCVECGKLWRVLIEPAKILSRQAVEKTA
jgi:hypothetical protein